MERSHRSLCKKIDYQFHNPELLVCALTHRSVGSRNNERLEFLGDGALNFVIASEIYHLRERYDEGQLSRLRATLVRGETLASIARELELGDFLRLGPGELKSGGFKRDSILADAVEAIIGAVYLDSGFDSVTVLVRHLFGARLTELPSTEPQKDPKTRLQEYLQGRKVGLPSYTLKDARGEAHKQTFTVECALESLGIVLSANGTSRRKAEQAAAAAVLERLDNAASETSANL